MVRSGFLAVVAAMVAAGPALGLSPRDCAVTPDVSDLLPGEMVLNASSDVPVDLGGGWVAQGNRIVSEAGTQENTVVTHCPSGSNVLVVERALGPDGDVRLNATLRAAPVFRESIASPETVSIDFILARLEAAGANIGVNQAPVELEACACAVFYPAERGDKTPWAEWGAP